MGQLELGSPGFERGGGPGGERKNDLGVSASP